MKTASGQRSAVSTQKSAVASRHSLSTGHWLLATGDWLGAVGSIALKEMKTFYVSLRAYVLTAVFLLINGWIFWSILDTPRAHSMLVQVFFMDMGITLIFIIPAATMRLFAEEKRSGTLELLLTSPVTDWQVVLGKFFGAMGVVMVSLALTLYVPIILTRVGEPDLGPFWSSYIGLLLFSSAMVGVGLLCSALTDSQIVAAVPSFGLILFLYIIHWPVQGSSSIWAKIAQHLSLFERFEPFTTGVVNTKDVVFFLAFTLLMLFISVQVLGSRRWR